MKLIKNQMIMPSPSGVFLFASLFFTSINSANAFNLPSFPNIFKPATENQPGNVVTKRKEELLKAISNTSNGKNASPETQVNVLSIVGELERTNPPSEELLSDASVAKDLDGVWYLQYTSPSEIEDAQNVWKPEFATEGEANIETGKFNQKGAISAQGIKVDTSNRVVKQIFDVSQSTVSNEISLDSGVLLQVGGTFRPSNNVARRAVVSFKDLNIVFKEKNDFTLRLGFIFLLLSIFRGTEEIGWLETTFLSDDLRVGRGNKGTMFVLTRDFDAVQA
eukprot:CAMPEP_0195519084 /NCGR_PEP_ID=MMETSP0794_2-20130614/14354_1 /TAXON_ID=515487 /ORGANISM="Stephanopyxis turris, Strain CCMP 815" /LENGTH=277 /DNA_ID=CAMNT_0040648187 /DNA_START=60 /DNA_END=893 /DNA_ORIENTATION=+